MLREVMDAKLALLKKAEAEFATAKENGLQESIKIARKAIAKARSEVKVTEEKHKDQSSNLIGIVAAWGKGKTENRKAWAQAIHTIVSGGRGTGSILFHAFPQEAIDAIAERTNGIRVRLHITTSPASFMSKTTFSIWIRSTAGRLSLSSVMTRRSGNWLMSRPHLQSPAREFRRSLTDQLEPHCRVVNPKEACHQKPLSGVLLTG